MDCDFYHIWDDNGLLLLIMYVDNFLTSSNKAKLNWLKHQLLNRFEISDLGFLLGGWVSCVKSWINAHSTCIHPIHIARIYNDVNPTSIPLLEGLKLRCELNVKLFNASIYCKLVGKLIYLFNSRPYLLFIVGVINIYMHVPRELH